MTAEGLRNHTYMFDISQADPTRLDAEAVCQGIVSKLIEAAGMTELQSLTHRFTPQGVSVVTLLAESHIALHTWPELGTGYITLTTCKKPGASFVRKATELVEDAFTGKTVTVKEV
jgi:S-adenosylmethionine decarboxylase